MLVSEGQVQLIEAPVNSKLNSWGFKGSEIPSRLIGDVHEDLTNLSLFPRGGHWNHHTGAQTGEPYFKEKSLDRKSVV